MENAVAYVEYIKQDSKIIVFKTEVPETISKIDDSIEYLMKRILRHCEENNTELDIRCPFAKAIIGKYPASKHNP